MQTVIEVTGVNGDVVVLSGDHVGVDGMWLASELEGFYDPEISVNSRSVSNRPGTQYISHRVLERRVIFKVTIANDDGPGNTWRERDARWRKLWSYDRYTEVRVVTDEGERTLKARLEEIEVDTNIDPHVQSATDVIMTIVADDPFWYAPDETFNVTVNRTATIPVLIANPTSNPIFPVWVLEAPGEWEIPDWSPEEPGKTVRLPEIRGSSHLVVDTDPMARQLISAAGDPVWARMNGVRFRNAIPGYTRELDLEVSVDASGPREVQLRLKRPFNRPWGA